MQKRLVLAVTVLSTALVAAAVAACSDDTAVQPLPLDAGSSLVDVAAPSADAGADARGDSATADAAADTSVTDSGPVDAPPALPDTGINGCRFEDFADADYTAPAALRIVRFPNDASVAQYMPACMTVKSGQSVTWTGDFYSHPLLASSVVSPIPRVDDGGPTGSVTVPFYEAGVFPYECETHAKMRGAINVAP